jgi:hypothetical protein
MPGDAIELMHISLICFALDQILQDNAALTLLDFKLATIEHVLASTTYGSDAAGKNGYYPVDLFQQGVEIKKLCMAS